MFRSDLLPDAAGTAVSVILITIIYPIAGFVYTIFCFFLSIVKKK